MGWGVKNLVDWGPRGWEVMARLLSMFSDEIFQLLTLDETPYCAPMLYIEFFRLLS